MTRFLARRLLNYAVLLVIASFMAFALTSWSFNPLESLESRSPKPPPEVIQQTATMLNLDKPLLERYVHWVAGTVRGDLGFTITGQPVTAELWQRIGVSLRLVLIGSIIGTVIGVVIGAWGAIQQYHLSDRVITIISLILISTPTFVLASVLMLPANAINHAVGFELFQYINETSASPPGDAWGAFTDRLTHLVLPTTTLALFAIAGYSRYQRNAMLDELGRDYIRTARAKGLTRRQALFKHGLRTALIPMATLFAYSVGGLVTGSVFVEQIFAWHGMGEWVLQGITNQDTNVVVAYTLFTGVTVLLAGMLSDVVYAALDPRVRVS